MSSTGTWVVPSRSFETGLAELRQWRQSVADRLAAFRRWGIVGRTLDDQTAARIAYLERRLLAERMTIAFVAEYSRGKSELINALFFADLGARLLPSNVGRTTLCPTEILWDPARPASLRLLPIETRASPKALREFIAEGEGWTEIALDPERPATLAPACEALSESRIASAEEAASLGFEPDDGRALEIPRWRYAVVNLPHPLLKDGLVILDTPGHNTVGSEPEITVHRLPEAAAIVFLLGADTGVTRSDRELWTEHIAPIHGVEQASYVVLNKIDGLRDGFKSESQILGEIERQIRATAEALRVPPTRVFALSARQGLTAKIQDDRDGLIKSRLYRLEQALARGIAEQRRDAHAAAARAETRLAFSESRALIASRLAFAREQLDEIAAIQGKNQKLVEALGRKAASERARIEAARAVLMGMRTLHNRRAGELSRLLDPALAREAGLRARAAVLESAFSRQIGEALDAFFRDARGRIRDAIAVIAEARATMEVAARRFADEFQIASVEVGEFSTERFLVEIDRLEQHCARDFKGAGSLITRRRSTLGTLFFDSVALKVVHVFEIADRESRSWLAGFVRPLEARLNDFQEHANSRVEGMGRIRDAEGDLIARLEELKGLAAEVAAQLEQCDAHREALLALLDHDVAREPEARERSG